MNKDTLDPSRERIKLRDSQSVYLKDETKEKIYDLIDFSDSAKENVSTITDEAINLLYEKREIERQLLEAVEEPEDEDEEENESESNE